MAKVECSHCKLEFDESVMIKESDGNKELYFCCKGCQGVYHLLNSKGLDSFYEKRGNTKLEPANISFDDLERFDLEGFHKKYVKKTKDGFNEINLIIEGIHCSACVWLNEKVLHQTPGIIEATINYSNNKAKVIWDEEEIKLSKIIETIRAIGYNAYPYDPAIQEEKAKKLRNDYYTRILVGVFATMNIMWIAIAQYVGYFTGIEESKKNILNIAEFALATPTLFYSGWIFFKGAYYGLKNRFINMDLLVSVGALLAYIYSVWAMITKQGEVYFDSVTMIITFVLVGKYLEILSKKQAVDTLDKIMGQTPTEVLVIKGDKKKLEPIENVKIGDIIEVKPGEKVVIDGIIISGSALVDMSALTGESEPILKRAGDEIISGSIVLDSKIEYKATKEAKNSLLFTINELLNDAITKKPHIEQLANQISGYFSVTILTLALLTFFGWYYIGGVGFEKSLIIAISVIVIACPCALGLATPMATLVGISRLAKEGIVFKEASRLETMAKATLLALDKTGTITIGKPLVTNYKKFKDFDINLLYTLVSSSNHPISKGVKEFLKEHFENLKEIKLDSFKEIQAKGVEAKVGDKKIIGGNLELLKDNNINFNYISKSSLYIVSIDGEVVALFELSDKIKEKAKELIDNIHKLGLKVVMLTGDRQEVAKEIAKEIGIDEVKANLLPQDKAKLIDEFHKNGEIIIMVGDGINDSIALAKSDIAIAMGSGADIAVEISDVIILNNSLESLRRAIAISKKVFIKIKQNLGFSLIYNAVVIPLAMAGYINPLFAALSMSLSSLVVVGNSFRLYRAKV
ncbi:MAG: cadmium-translocating P-type ATPase [Epsilonproteobacteria bacterium]|nr:cadmium-translocating P-type ATPase [Campylobacterota bacterium]